MKDKLSSILFFVLFLYTTIPTPLFSISELTDNILYAIFPAFLAFIVGIIKKVDILNTKVILIWIILGCLSICQYFINGSRVSPYPFIVVFIVNISIQLYRFNFIDRFVKISYVLTIVDLVLWGITVFYRNQMLHFAQLVGVPAMANSWSLYIYSLGVEEIVGGIERNSGYCWEAGRYSCFLCISMFFIMLKDNKFWRNTKFQVFLMALISTMSTTGYSVFLIMLIMKYGVTKKTNILAISLLPFVVMSVMSLSFMQEKIVNLFRNEQDIETRISEIYWNQQNRNIYSYKVPQRFEGLMFQSMNFVHMNPIVGEGRNFSNYYINRELGLYINPSEGLIGILLRYGCIAGLFAYFFVYRASRRLSERYRFNNPFMFLVIFLGINISYNFWEFPLIAYIWLMPYFIPQTQWNLQTFICRK